ncbi:MAG: hypothetical protein MI919_06725 [Holophagales bacterium]|nr:hypothetical protein [Holophagales bacterium]
MTTASTSPGAGSGRWPEDLIGRLRTLRAELRRARYSVKLLLDRRLWLFLGIDLMLLFSTSLEALVAGAEVGEMFRSVVLLPTLILGVPAMASLVALERRSGSLELALSARSTERFFLVRIAPVALFCVLQGWMIVILSGIDQDLADVGRALFQTVATVAFVTAAVLFWAVRLRSSGGVILATLATAACLWPWLHKSPEMPRHLASGQRTLGVDDALWAWGWCAVVMATATALLFSYARIRLRRPDTLLD